MSRLNKRQRLKARRQRRAERRAVRGSVPRVASAAARSGVSSAAEPVRGRVAEIIDPYRYWYIVRTLPRMGARAERALHDIGVKTFLPRTSQVVVRSGLRVVRFTPLIFRTLFIGVWHEDDLALVQAQPGIAEVVAYTEVERSLGGNIPQVARRPARLDPADLQRFVDAIARGEIVQPVGVQVGSSVVVMTGPFASFPATVEAILPGDRLRVAVSIFGRPSPVELGMADVQAV